MNYHTYQQLQTMASKTFHAIFQGFSKYIFLRELRYMEHFQILHKYLQSSGIEHVTSMKYQYSELTFPPSGLIIERFLFRPICIAPQHPPGPRK